MAKRDGPQHMVYYNEPPKPTGLDFSQNDERRARAKRASIKSNRLKRLENKLKAEGKL